MSELTSCFAAIQKENLNSLFLTFSCIHSANIVLVSQASKLSVEDLMVCIDLVEVVLVDYSQRYASSDISYN